MLVDKEWAFLNRKLVSFFFFFLVRSQGARDSKDAVAEIVVARKCRQHVQTLCFHNLSGGGGGLNLREREATRMTVRPKFWFTKLAAVGLFLLFSFFFFSSGFSGAVT